MNPETDRMYSSKVLILLFFTLMLMSVPIYFIIPMDYSHTLGNWGKLELRTVHYLISVWGSWAFTVSMAVYYKWTEKKNLFFILNYIFLGLALWVFANYTYELFKNQIHPGQYYGDGAMTLIRTLKNALPLVGITIYLQLSVWWFGKKGHRR